MKCYKSKRFIQLPQLYIDEKNQKGFNKQDAGYTEIEPSNILYIEEFRVKNPNYKFSDDSKLIGDNSSNPLFLRYSIVHTITGAKIYIGEEPDNIRKIIEEFYEEADKDNSNKITISKDDLVKNFIFRNLG